MVFVFICKLAKHVHRNAQFACLVTTGSSLSTCESFSEAVRCNVKACLISNTRSQLGYNKPSAIGTDGTWGGTMSEDDVDGIAQNRHSTNTANQTKWAVSMILI